MLRLATVLMVLNLRMRAAVPMDDINNVRSQGMMSPDVRGSELNEPQKPRPDEIAKEKKLPVTANQTKSTAHGYRNLKKGITGQTQVLFRTGNFDDNSTTTG